MAGSSRTAGNGCGVPMIGRIGGDEAALAGDGLRHAAAMSFASDPERP